MAESAHRCQIYLIAETRSDGATPERLRVALESAQAACVLILPPAGGLLDKSEAKLLIEVAQHHGAAALICDDAPMAKTLGADGVHLSLAGPQREDEDIAAAFRSARETLGPGRIVGAAAGLSRHDAMVIGELGADYVALGQLADRGEEAGARVVGMTQWWSQVFEVSCVAFMARSLEAARALAEAGADFVAVPLEMLNAGHVPARELVRALAGGERVS